MSRTHWPFIAGGIALAGTAAIVSVLVLDDGEDKEAKARAVAEARAAELEREHQRLVAEAKIEKARAAAVAAAEQAKVAAEEEKRERESQEARQKELEDAHRISVNGVGLLSARGNTLASLSTKSDMWSGFGDKSIDDAIFGGAIGDKGGFGFDRSGSGPGGGGTGLGSIGTGQYGSLGHGDGTGQGYGAGRGGMRGRPPRAPTVRTTVSAVSGGLDKNVAIRIVQRHRSKVTACYAKQLALEPGLEGTIALQLEIAEDGAVTSSTASGLNDEVASCAAVAYRRVVFPHLTSASASVAVTFTLSPPAATP